MLKLQATTTILLATTANMLAFSFGELNAFTVSSRPQGFAIADFDRDGYKDIAVSIESTERVEIWRNNGTVSFARFGVPYFLGAGSGPGGIRPGDFDGDGDVDIAVVLSRRDFVRILWNDGNGYFSFGPLLPTGLLPTKLDVGNVDANSLPDMVVVNQNSASVSVLRNLGGGVFVHSQYPVGLDPRAVKLGDFDNDGDMDFAVCNFLSGSITVWRNDGSGTFSDRQDYPTIFPFRPFDIDVADLNNDGYFDIVVAGWGDGGNNDRVYGVNVLISAGATFEPPRFYNLRLWAGLEPEVLTLADFDLDGDIDIAGGHAANGAIALLANGGSGVFSPAFEMYAGADMTDMQSADMDNDGDDELMLTHPDHVDYFVNSMLTPWTRYVPTALDLVQGTIFSGNLQSLFVSDNDHLVLQQLDLTRPSVRRIQLILKAASPSQSPTGMRFVVESRASTSNINQRIELFDFVSNAWVELDSRTLTAIDEILRLQVQDPGRFVQSGTRVMYTRITCDSGGPTLAIFPAPPISAPKWTVLIDQAIWEMP